MTQLIFLIAMIAAMMGGLVATIWVMLKSFDINGEVEVDIKFKEPKKSKK